MRLLYRFIIPNRALRGGKLTLGDWETIARYPDSWRDHAALKRALRGLSEDDLVRLRWALIAVIRAESRRLRGTE